MDHNSNATILAGAMESAQRAGANLELASLQEDFLWQYRKVVTELRTRMLHDKYEMVANDQVPDREITFAGWLLKNQVKITDSGQQNIMDFQAPIELEVLIVPSEVT